MNKFTFMTKPMIVQAFKISDLESIHTIAMPGWLFPAIADGTICVTDNTVATKQGRVAFRPSTDWLIRLDDGEIYPCSDEVFQRKYETVPEQA